MSFRDSMAGFSYEKRPLKRARLGPPDVYPQEAKQREDELTAINVKQGFSHIPQLSDEFGTAKNISTLSATKLGTFINGTIAKKAELNALPDTGKRRLQVNTKDNFWPVTPRLKHVVDMFMKDLAGTKSLAPLAKRVPIFNKREEIFLTLADHEVPMLRAAWFLKMTASYNSAISEAKTKKRQMPDPTQEWTVSLLRSLKDILLRLSDWHNGGNGSLLGSNSNPGSNSSIGGSALTPTHTSSAVGSTPTPEDGNVSLRQWQYCTDFAKHLYEEGLIDRFDWLQWIIDACDRMKSLEDGGWKALVPLLLAFIPDIAQSELLARRLAHLAAKRLSPLFAEMEAPSSFTAPIHPPATLLEHLHCPFHRSTILTLVSALQVIVVECPTAMVFNGNNFSAPGSPNYGSSENTRTTLPPGSPLDLIAVSPSALPMPPRANNPIIRLQLRSIEEQIRLRSRAVEAKWACEEWQQSSAGPTLQKVLAALEALDLYSFDKVENSNCIETLYRSIFASTPICRENPAENDAPIVLLLCQWAVGLQRSGDYRALVVARLLEHRQHLVTSVHDQGEASNGSNGQQNSNSTENSKNESTSGDEITTNGTDTNSGSESQGANGIQESSSGNTNSNGNGTADDDESEGYTGLPIYHNLLFKYLDTDAPTLDDTTISSKVKFSSLVHLFAALIRHEIFSHDTYLCTLVARGDLSAFPPPPLPPSGQSGMTQMQSVATPGQGPGSHAGPMTPASVSSTVTPGATPHHDLMDDGNNSMRGGGPLFQPLPRLQETLHRHQDYDDRMDNIDDDLDRILRHITQEQQENMDQIDSPKEENVPGFSGMQSSHQPPSSNSNSQSDSIGGPRSGGPGGTPNHNTIGGTPPGEVVRQSRHRLYVTHFPLPQDEAYQHEANQRHILLYGVGRARDESKHVVKKISKDLTKLFTKKFCYDIADGSRVKKHSKNEISLESLQSKFMGLPFFDQHALTSSTASTVLEMLSSFGGGRSSCLPTVEHITFLTELMEVGLNVMGIIETTVQILRELPEVEAQLILRGSPITASYITALQMQVVAILRRYHCSLLLDPELTTEAWEGLIRIMRRFTNPLECTSAERCTLVYLTDLHASCNFLRSKVFTEFLNPIAAKLRTSLCLVTQPTLESNYGFNHSFMTQCLDNPRRKVDPMIIRQLNESGNCRYSFVSNAILSICNEADAERLNDLASLCAEMTAVCPTLSSEWLGVLLSLCSPSRHVAVYADVLAEIDVKHLSIHSSLATLTAMLVARQCFTLQDIVVKVVIPSLLKAWNESRGPRDTDTEAGARLTCYLLLSLFKTQDVMNPNLQPSILKLSSDRRLLSATHSGITFGAVLAAFKAMLLLADTAIANERRREQRPGMPPGELSISHILGTSDVLPLERNESIRVEPRTLASFALSALQQMCAEPWVRQRCLRDPVELCQEDMLLDPIVSTKQAQRLLHLICYPELMIPDEALEPRTQVPRIIMERLDQWNLREARVALTLQNRQLANNSADYQAWLDTVARSALEVFHLGEEAGQEYVVPHSATPSPAPGKSPRSGKKGQDSIAKTPPNYHNVRSTSGDRGVPPEKKESEGRGISAASAWLVAPLIEKLSTQVQGRVLRHAGNVLESTLWPKTAPKKASGTGLHSHLPFLALILTCLRGQDEQRETLLQSLLTQFTQLLQFAKEADAEGKTETLRDALRLRLSLVGGMFDAVQRSTQATAEWAVVLTQLVTHSVVDLNTNSDVFFTVVDMVTALVHSTQVTEAGDRVEEVRKQNLNLIKKLKKELTDRDSESIKPMRQLLPFSRVFAEIVVTQSTSTIVDSKGNRVQSFEYVDKKPGLQVWEKQRVSPWEILECQRHPAPLSWSWFGAVKMERKPLRYEEAHRLNKFHTHNMVKPFTHFLEPVPLPPEEIDLKPEVHIREEINLKPDTPISMMSDQSPRGPIPKVTKPKLPRKKRLTKAQQEQQKIAQAQAAAAQAQQQQQQQQHVPIQNTPTMGTQLGSGQFPGGPHNPMAGGPTGNQPPPPNYQGGPPQWGYNGQPQQQPPQQQPPQQPYYPPQPGQVPPGPRINQSPKAALHNLLRARTVPPGGPNQFQQFPQGPPGGPGGAGPRHGPGILRQQLKGPGGQQQPQPGQMPNPGQAGFQAGPPSAAMMQQQQQQMQQSQGMNQNYGYNNQAGMGGMGPGQQPTPGLVPVQQGAGPMMNPQQQPGQMQMMGGPRGAGQQDMNFGGAGNRPMGPRGNAQFMQGGPQQQQGMGGPMQAAYGRPNMPGQMSQGNMTGQMVQGQGQMGQGQPGQMVGVPQGMGGMNQMGQQAGMMGQGAQQQVMMGQGQQQPGIMNQGQPQPGMMGQGQQQSGMMGQGQQQSGMMGQGQPQSGMMGQGQQPGMMGQQQAGMMGQGQQQPGMMGQQQPGMMGQGQQQPGMMGQGQQGMMTQGQQQPGMMGQGPQQRMRQQMMMQQQHQMGMRGPGQQQMHYNPNPPGGY